MVTSATVFGDVKVGEAFTFDIGGGNWSSGWVKIGPFDATRDGVKLGISFWTKVR